jgi:hypothetical protein
MKISQLRNRNTFLLFILLIFLITACAPRANTIKGDYVSSGIYSGYNCEQLNRELYRVESRMQFLERDLDKEANKDEWQTVVGIALFWPALFFLEGKDTPQAREYSRLKGEHQALKEMLIQKNCNIK